MIHSLVSYRIVLLPLLNRIIMSSLLFHPAVLQLLRATPHGCVRCRCSPPYSTLWLPRSSFLRCLIAA
jgi:hypothetical protein